VRTRLAPLVALAVALFPASALADDGPTPASGDQATVSCLTPKGTVDGLSIRGVRVGVQANIRDANGNRLDVNSVSYCVDGGGEFSFALDRNADVVLVLSTADGDSIGPINPTTPAASARAEFPNMQKLTKTTAAAAYRVDSKRQLVLGIAASRVAFVAAADRLLLEYPNKLGYYMKRLGF
jgi:hypothetical protein